MGKSREEISKITNTITDLLGNPIDEGIKPLVNELNYKGIYTTSSCEGHIEHGCKYFWVHIEKECINKLQKYLNRCSISQIELKEVVRIYPTCKNLKEGRNQIEILIKNLKEGEVNKI